MKADNTLKRNTLKENDNFLFRKQETVPASTNNLPFISATLNKAFCSLGEYTKRFISPFSETYFRSKRNRAGLYLFDSRKLFFLKNGIQPFPR